MRGVAFPTGRCYSPPSDTLSQEVSQIISTDTAVRAVAAKNAVHSQNHTSGGAVCADFARVIGLVPYLGCVFILVRTCVFVVLVLLFSCRGLGFFVLGERR